MPNNGKIVEIQVPAPGNYLIIGVAKSVGDYGAWFGYQHKIISDTSDYMYMFDHIFVKIQTATGVSNYYSLYNVNGKTVNYYPSTFLAAIRITEL